MVIHLPNAQLLQMPTEGENIVDQSLMQTPDHDLPQINRKLNLPRLSVPRRQQNLDTSYVLDFIDPQRAINAYLEVNLFECSYRSSPH